MKRSGGLSERLAADFADIFGGDHERADAQKTAQGKHDGTRAIRGDSLGSSVGAPPSTRVCRSPEAD